MLWGSGFPSSMSRRKTRIDECYACQYETKITQYNEGQEGETWLCDLCASTPAGNYPNCEMRTVLRTICYVGNAILEAIERLEAEKG